MSKIVNSLGIGLRAFTEDDYKSDKVNPLDLTMALLSFNHINSVTRQPKSLQASSIVINLQSSFNWSNCFFSWKFSKIILPRNELKLNVRFVLFWTENNLPIPRILQCNFQQ
jgi:hypothetical protein